MASCVPIVAYAPNPLPVGWTLSNQALLSPSGRGPRRLSAEAYVDVRLLYCILQIRTAHAH